MIRERSCFVKKLWFVLFRNRQVTLSYLIGGNDSEVESFPHASPSVGSSGLMLHDWPIFQTICTEDLDPSLKTFKILLSMVSNYSNDGLPLPSFVTTSVIFCFDEMQCDIIEEAVKWPFRQELHDVLERIPIAHRLPQLKITQKHPLIGGGTSLQILKCENIFSNSLRFENFVLEFIHSYEKYHKTVSTFKRKDDAKTIASHDEFHKLCHRHVAKLISRMSYLVHSNEATERHQLWNSLAPGDFGDDEKECFYRSIKTVGMAKMVS
ncbi:hypothetical protein EPUS_02078 [Endocarpon pusillum Z07020]|uniref:Uncharacterized protein n=1 Tax=Endocarpon pusillum (strain Z07020 / HMAS-L-300199) TaxID=1263415 RepID=U1GK26_ENDPU|nr:uncharacterized protein EPUS_02078 [Endocarpon pusillum Z07020]ERF72191.1 hypothetical protein EPUS_02078 [Endocarpon pusillum Z07020]